MKGALFKWLLLLFCVTASLQFVFSIDEEEDNIMDLSEVENESDLQEDKQSPVHKRNLFQFGSMISCATRRSRLAYSSYGNWCGVGGSGTPVDGADRCCYHHDMCYSSIQKHSRFCRPYWRMYKYQAIKQGDRGCSISCDNELGSCSRGICECDKAATLCFARNPYHPEYRRVPFLGRR